MNNLTLNQKIFISALVGFVIGAGAVWVWTIVNTPTTGERAATEENVDSSTAVNADVGDNEDENAATSPDAPAPSAPASGENLITVENQEAGDMVEVTATLTVAGWVAIHEDRNGSLGNVLGALWLPAGTHEDTVELLRATAPGMTYHAVLYSDDGNKMFDVGSESMIMGADREVVQTTFTTR